MSYSIYPTPDFKRAFKKLSKKYKSIKNDLLALTKELSADPNSGNSLGNSVYKVRMKISDKNKGKSGGARVITYVIKEDKEVYLIHIYDKSTIENITEKHIEILLKNAGLI